MCTSCLGGLAVASWSRIVVQIRHIPRCLLGVSELDDQSFRLVLNPLALSHQKSTSTHRPPATKEMPPKRKQDDKSDAATSAAAADSPHIVVKVKIEGEKTGTTSDTANPADKGASSSSSSCLGYPTWEMDPCYFTQPLETPAVPPRLTS